MSLFPWTTWSAQWGETGCAVVVLFGWFQGNHSCSHTLFRGEVSMLTVYDECAHVLTGELGQLVGKSVRLIIERLWVWIPAGVAGEFSSPELTLCWLLFSICTTPMLSQLHVKNLVNLPKSAGGRLHLNTLTPLTKPNQSGLTVLLSRHSEGT